MNIDTRPNAPFESICPASPNLVHPLTDGTDAGAATARRLSSPPTWRGRGSRKGTASHAGLLRPEPRSLGAQLWAILDPRIDDAPGRGCAGASD